MTVKRKQGKRWIRTTVDAAVWLEFVRSFRKKFEELQEPVFIQDLARAVFKEMEVDAKLLKRVYPSQWPQHVTRSLAGMCLSSKLMILTDFQRFTLSKFVAVKPSTKTSDDKVSAERRFLAKNYILTPSPRRITACPLTAIVYSEYLAYCRATGHYPLSPASFGRECSLHGVVVLKSAGKRFYGVKGTNEDSPDLVEIFESKLRGGFIDRIAAEFGTRIPLQEIFETAMSELFRDGAISESQFSCRSTFVAALKQAGFSAPMINSDGNEYIMQGRVTVAPPAVHDEELDSRLGRLERAVEALTASVNAIEAELKGVLAREHAGKKSDVVEHDEVHSGFDRIAKQNKVIFNSVSSLKSEIEVLVGQGVTKALKEFFK